jgi:CHC2 zinc finger
MTSSLPVSTKSHFDRTALPPARSFYECEGFTLTRANGKEWCMAKGQPPCHKSESGRSFSVSLSHGGFRCFGCGAKGDLIKFVQLRDGCDFVTACKTLGCWRGNTAAEERKEIVRREQERQWHRQRDAEQKEAERRERLKLRDELLTTVRILNDLGALLHEVGPVGTVAESCWSALPLTLDCLRLEQSEYCNLAGLENPYE